MSESGHSLHVGCRRQSSPDLLSPDRDRSSAAKQREVPKSDMASNFLGRSGVVWRTCAPKPRRTTEAAPHLKQPATARLSRTSQHREPRRISLRHVAVQHGKSNDIARLCATTCPHTVVCRLVMEQVIAYLRVSTQRQQRSGLGIEAQRTHIANFAAT